MIGNKLLLVMLFADMAPSPGSLYKATPHPAEHSFTTACGLEFTGPSKEQQALQAAETQALASFARYASSMSDKRADCAALKNWAVVVHRAEFFDSAGAGGWTQNLFGTTLRVVGYTHAQTRVVELGDARFLSNSLTHELVHVIQHAQGSAGNHCHWEVLGIKRAIKHVTGAEDYSVSDC